MTHIAINRLIFSKFVDEMFKSLENQKEQAQTPLEGAKIVGFEEGLNYFVNLIERYGKLVELKGYGIEIRND